MLSEELTKTGWTVSQALMRRELASRYTGSVAGCTWLLLQPLIMLGVYAFVFGVIFRGAYTIQTDLNIPYIAFIAVGLWPWFGFSEAITHAMTSIQRQSSLVKKVAFPTISIVIASVSVSFFVHCLGSLVVLAALSISGVTINWIGIFGYFFCFISLLVPAAGIALALAALQVFLRDLEQLIPQLITLAFYATPILYSREMVPDWIQPITDANPFGALITTMRAAVLPVTVHITPVQLVASLSSFLLIFAAGLFLFYRLEPHFEDVL